MAWFDILGGVAGGLQQGLGQLQQAQQAKQAEARQLELLKLQQAQDIRAAEAAKRQEEQFHQQERDRMEASFFKEASVQDPFNVDPAFASMYPEQAKKYLAVDPKTSKVTIRMDPVKRAEAQENFNRLQGRTTLREQFRTPEFSALSENERLRLGQQAAAMGMEPKEILAAIGPISDPNRRILYNTIISPEKAAELSQREEEAKLQSRTTLAAAGIRAKDQNDLEGRQLFDIINADVRELQTRLREAEKYVRENSWQAPNKLKPFLDTVANLKQELQSTVEKLNEVVRSSPALKSVASYFNQSATAAAPTVSADPLGLFK